MNARPTSSNAAAPRGQFRAARARRCGFTLIETALATVIVGVGVISVMTLLAALTEQNATANRATTGMLLATHIQEAMASLPFNDPGSGSTTFGPESGETLASFDDTDDFDGQSLSPPIDSTRTAISQLSQFTQVISVWPVYANQLASNTNPASPDLPKSTYTGALRVMVRVLYKRTPTATAQEVYRTTWLRTAS